MSDDNLRVFIDDDPEDCRACQASTSRPHAQVIVGRDHQVFPLCEACVTALLGQYDVLRRGPVVIVTL